MCDLSWLLVNRTFTISSWQYLIEDKARAYNNIDEVLMDIKPSLQCQDCICWLSWPWSLVI